MPNNELFHRVALEALADDTSMSGLLIDLDIAFETYLTGMDEDGKLDTPSVREEIKHARAHVRVLQDNIQAWLEIVQSARSKA